MRNGLRLLVSLWVAGSAFAASPSPDGKRLAFSFIGGPENIYVAAADGSGLAAIVSRPQRDFRPEWFPDGRSLLFTSAVEGGPQLFRVDRDGKDLKSLLPADVHASDGHPSPDGARVVFFKDFDQGFDLHVLNLSSGRIADLMSTPVFKEYAPRWSPDGRYIAFVGREMEDAVPDIWVTGADGRGRRNLTQTAKADEFHPSWSADGRRLVFIRVLDGEFAVHVLDVVTGEDVRVAHEEGVACFSPHFTPDDAWVTFTRNVFEGTKEGLPGVFRVRPDGTGLTRLAGVEPEVSD